MIRTSSAALCAGFCLLLASGAAVAGGRPPSVDVWAQSYADLPPDPAMRFGTLPNGMRYVVMKNATPAGQASFRLWVHAGSIDETDAQQGLAHFLEHMAFDGSQHVPAGEMVKILERHGLAFGADTNASTSWEETIYKLDPPKADEDTLNDSLMLLREAAGELTLAPDAIDHERGVVLSEERLRDTPDHEVLKQSFAFNLNGLKAANRFPIGLVSVIKAAGHDQLADFYRAHYRPDRAVLVAVGDFDPDAMEAKIKARFGDWVAQGPAAPAPDLGKPRARGGQTKLVVQPGVQETLQFDWVSPPDRDPDSAALRKRDTLESLALAVLNRRLDRLARSDDPPFTGAGAYREDMFHSAKVTTLQVESDPGQWPKALAAADQEARRLIRYGVSAPELAEEIDASRAALKEAADGQATRNTPAVADDITATLSIPEVETSPAEDLALFDAAVKGLTPQDLADPIKAVFGGEGPLVMLSTPDPVDGGQDALTQALKQSEAAPVTAPAAQAALSWPYENFGAYGHVADRRDITDLDTVFVRFDNGVRLTIKPTKFKDDEILVRVRIGDGALDLPADRATPAWAAASAFPEGGLGKMDADDVDAALRSRIVGKSFDVGDDGFDLSGTTRPDDLETQMQLMAAYVSDPGWRPEAFLRLRNAGPTILDQLAATPAGVLDRDLGQLLHSGDRRWGVPTKAEITAQTPDQLKAMLAPILAKAPIEVVIVGDTTVEKAIDAVAGTLGALPPRPAQSDPATLVPPGPFPRPTTQPVSLTHSGRSDQAVGLEAWPIDDFLSDTQRARDLFILGDVLQLRVTDQLRRAEGVTYSPSAAAAPSQFLPGYGYLSVRVEAPPAKLDGFFADVATIAQDLREHEVSADELERAKKPALDDLERRRETNDYWLNALEGAQTDDRRLMAIRSSIAQLERIDAADVRKAAQSYLVDDKAWKLEITPAR